MSAARLLIPLVLGTSLLAPGFHLAPADPAPSVGQAAGAHPWITLPKIAEHRYRVKAKIRLLLFWVGKDNVGSARMAWYRGEGADRGYELLLGSDPERAPRRINRWGYVSEEHRSGTATTFGVMKPSGEASLEEAKANVDAGPSGGVVFAMLRETVTGSEAVAQTTTARLSRDYSFRDFDALMDEFAKVTTAPAVTRARLDADVAPGLLTAIAGVIHQDAAVRRSSRAPRGAQGRVVRYAYNAKTFTLTLASSQFVGAQEYDGRRYTNLVENDFEITMKGFSWKEKFTMVYAMEEGGTELPVFAVYQPRWWFKAELLLDDSQVL